MIKWASAFVGLGILDLPATCYHLSLGGTEANPLFADAAIPQMAIAKILGSVFVAGVCLYWKRRTLLVLFTGINLCAFMANILAIWRLGGLI